MQEELDSSARAFYEEAAVGATAVGACIDLFVVSPVSCGLDQMEALTGSTGGVLYLYPHLETASLPQVAVCRTSSSTSDSILEAELCYSLQ